MPDPAPATIGVVADLTFEVGHGDSRTRAHLSGGPVTLVLDVDDPAVLLRSLPSGGPWRRLPAAGTTDLLSGTTIQVRSGGNALGSVRFTRGRRAAVRPTGAGLLVGVRELLARRPVRIAGGLLVATFVVVRVRSRLVR